VGSLTLLLALGGIYVLVRKKQAVLLAILLSWPMHALLYLAFYIRPGFLLLAYFIPLILTAICAAYFLSDEASRLERLVALVVLIGISAYSLVAWKPAFVAMGVPFVAVLVMDWVMRARSSQEYSRNYAGLLLALSAGLILHGSFGFPVSRPIGLSPEEKAVHYLLQHFSEGVEIAAVTPLPAVAAKLERADLLSMPTGVNGLQSFESWLIEHKIKAVFIDGQTAQSHPEIWKVIEASIGSVLKVGFVADPGGVQVLVVSP
jgi:hypothetical protein